MAITETFYSTNDVAQMVNRDPSHIRRLCIDNEIGRKHGRDWLLSQADVAQIKTFLRPAKSADDPLT